MKYVLKNLSEAVLEHHTLCSIQRASGSQVDLIHCWEDGSFAQYFTNSIIQYEIPHNYLEYVRSYNSMPILKKLIWDKYQMQVMPIYKRLLFDFKIAGRFG